MIKRYIEYLKDNPKGYWFKAKWFGWGWTPVKWQGWLTIVIYIGLISLIINIVEKNSHSISDTIYGIFIPFTVLTVLLITVCYLKGEKPYCSWGPPKKKNK